MLNTGEIKPTADATFLASTMEMTTTGSASSDLTGQTAGGTTSDRSTVLNTLGFTGSYGSTTGYRLTDALTDVSFGPGQLTSDTTVTDKNYPTVFFTKVVSPIEDYLALYKLLITSPSASGAVSVTAKYGGAAAWQHTTLGSTSRRTRLNYFAYGPATPVSAMPRSGVVRFSLGGSGNYAGDKDLYFTSQFNTVTVDFAAGTISGTLTGSGSNFYTSGFGGLFGVTMAGTIMGNTVSGATGSTVAVATGQFRLLFVGPNAEEIIVTYVGQDGRGTYVGSSVGVHNPYL